MSANSTTCRPHIARLQQQCHNSKCVIFQEKILKVLKCCNFLGVQQRLNCFPAARFANCLMIRHLLKVHLQRFISIPTTQKFRTLSCDTLVANERYVCSLRFTIHRWSSEFWQTKRINNKHTGIPER